MEATHPTPDELRAFRERHGLTQNQAAKLVYRVSTAWYAWEAGTYKMDPALWQFVQIRKGDLKPSDLK